MTSVAASDCRVLHTARRWSTSGSSRGLLRAVCLAIVGLVAVAATQSQAACGPGFAVSQLDRIAFAIDGAESSHGSDPAMWRLDLEGPQGPMQVTWGAAADVGGGDRFDVVQNRKIGRAYLAHMYRRYGNWPDVVAAYIWGTGNLDTWIRGGRTPQRFPDAVLAYQERVLGDFDHGIDSIWPSHPDGCGIQADPLLRHSASHDAFEIAWERWKRNGMHVVHPAAPAPKPIPTRIFSIWERSLLAAMDQVAVAH
jgi:hypothetical protein